MAKTDELAGVTSNYTYDPIYELTQVQQANSTTESYTYDPVGNRLSSLSVASYTVNSSNELTGSSNASYTYDQNGNTTSKTDSTGTTNYTWDYENRLTSVTLPGSGGAASFKYDPFGRRIQKAFTQSGTTTTTNYVYDGDNVVETVDQNGNVLSRFGQSQNIDEPLAESTSGGIDYYEQDGLGSITSLTSSAGALAQTYTYDSFGNTTNSSGNVANPFRYTGRDFDSETGLYYYRARYYDPGSGRFLNEDPTNFQGGSNFYEYAGNAPISLVDPTGDCPINLQLFVKTLDDNAEPGPTEWCAKHLRIALHKAGAPPPPRANMRAKDYGSYLTSIGFSKVPNDSVDNPQVGDVVIFQPVTSPIPSNPAGHIEAFDGSQYVSDYKQGIPIWPQGIHFYPNFKKYGPQPYTVYRCK